jgi:hypothetical protein
METMKTEITKMQAADAVNQHWMSCWLGDANYNKTDIYARLNATTFQNQNARRTAETREKLFALIGA